MKHRVRAIRLAGMVVGLMLIFILPGSAGAITGGPTVPVDTNASSKQGEPDLAANGSAGFVIAWMSFQQDTADSAGVYFRRFDQSLNPLSDELRANETVAGDQDSPAIAAVGGGDFVITWTSSQPSGQDYDIYFRRFGSDGAALGGEVRANSDRTGYQMNPAVIPNGGGTFTIIWASHAGNGSDPAQLLAQRFDADGDTIGSEFPINDLGNEAKFSRGPHVAPDDSGGFVVAWAREEPELSSGSIYFRHFDASGNSLAGPLRVSPFSPAGQYPTRPAIAVNDSGGFDVVWDTIGVAGGALFLHRFDADGSPLGGQVRIDAPPQYEAEDGSIAADPGGGFTVAWVAREPSHVRPQVYAQRFGASGAMLTFASPMDQTATSSFDPKVIADGGGGFVGVWGAEEPSIFDIFLRNFVSLPETTIDEGPPEPPGLITDTTPTFAFSVDEPNSSFECRVDDDTFSSCASPHTLPTQPDGPHTFEVRAKNANGTDPSPASRSFLLDATPPETSIESGPSGPTQDTTPSFAFSSDDLSATIECKLDFGAFKLCDSPLSVGPLADGLHSFSVRATDPAGNVTPSAPVRVFTVDTTPPSVAFTQGPSEGSLSNDPTPAFGFSAGEAVAFSCELDGQPAEPCTSPFTTPPLPDGPHQLQVSATDQVGLSDEAARHFTIDTLAPETAITTGPPELSNDATPTFAFTADEASSGFECRLDGGAFGACTSPVTVGGLPEGPHSFEVRARDQASNTDPSPASLQFTLDTTPPETSIDSKIPDPTKDPTPSFALGANEPGSSFQCALNGGDFSPCSSPFAPPALRDGDHTFLARSIDRAGNVDPTPASRSITVDTRPPSVALRGPKKQVAGKPIKVTIGCDERCTADGSGTILVKRTRFDLRSIAITLAAGRPTQLTMEPGRKAQRRITMLASKGRKARVRIAFKFTDQAGNSSAAIRTFATRQRNDRLAP